MELASKRDAQRVAEEASSTFDIARCAAYCLHHKYPTAFLAFMDRAFSDWTITRTQVYISQGTRAPSSRRPPPFSIQGRLDPRKPLPAKPNAVPPPPPRGRDLEKALHRDVGALNAYAELFAAFLRNSVKFHVVGSAPRLVGNVSVYQEPMRGTCWLAATLNLLMHIPEARVILWNAIGKKRPTTDDTLLDLFLSSAAGRRIFEVYREHMHKTFDDVQGMDGGNAPVLLFSFLSVIGLHKADGFKLELLMGDGKELLNAAVKHPEKYANLFLDIITKMFRATPTMRGALLVGKKRATDGRTLTGHAAAVVRDADDSDLVRIYNWGTSGPRTQFLDFLKHFPDDLQFVSVHLATPRRRLEFSE